MNKIFALIIGLFIFAGYSQLSYSQQLTASQQQQAIEMYKQHLKETQNAEIVNRADQWVSIGERIGVMIGSAAKEIGVATNEFIKTPVGKLAIGLIVWHMFGSMVIHIFGAIATVLIGSIFLRIYINLCRKTTIEYDQTKKTMFGNPVQKTVTHSPLSTECLFIIVVMMIAIALVSLAILFTY